MSGRPGFAVGQSRFPTNDTLHFWKKSAPVLKKTCIFEQKTYYLHKISLTSVIKPHKRALFERAW
jgi:hypothetical protein